MKRDRKLLVLYSWENDPREAQKWALSLCCELQRYESVEASCDMLWVPYSDVKQGINQKIHEADNILVVVTKSYNKKIEYNRGMVSYEKLIYEKVVNQSKEKNKILFLQKDPDVPLPRGWDNYNRIDVSIFNRDCFFQKSAKEREERIDQIIRFCFSIPEYSLSYRDKKELPKSISAQTFAQRYCEDILQDNWRSENSMSVKQQEIELLELIKKNVSQESFVDLYIRAGLSADLNFGGRITPQLFKKHFLVNREDKEDEKYNEIINELFSATNQNCLCLQSDGGSGKSTFIQTMSLRRKSKVGEYFTNVIFDLSNLTENNNTKEDLLFQKVRKEYNRMSKNMGTYYIAWRRTFEERVHKLNEIVFNDSRLYAVHDVQANLREALPNLVPNPDKLDDWYKGYTARISKAKNADSKVLFIILIMIYLMILDCKPQLDNTERFILVFDNIETYDNGRAAEKISNYVETCYKYAKNIFLELGMLDSFYKKFTLVVVLRTSTLIPFGNLQTDMWAGDHFVKQIKYFDFTEEALLKKLRFLRKIPGYKNTLLFKRMYAIVSLMLPTKKIDEYLRTGNLSDVKYRYFTSKRILPLFNNDYRKTMRNLYTSIINEDRNPRLYSSIIELTGLEGSVYDYSVNGIRMALIRDVFNRLKVYNYFEEIGFPELSGVEEYSMTRLVLSYLYWSEVQFVAHGYAAPYIGTELSKIANTFKYFCSHEKLVNILYGLSIYSNKNRKKGAALHEWGNLLIFDNLNVDLTQDEFDNAIKQYLKSGTAEVKIGELEINLEKINVRLSDAGMCFTQHYIRSFEFLLSRKRDGAYRPALFLMKRSNTIIESLDGVYEIIKNCIVKLINGCGNICVLYGKEKKECAYRKGPSNLNMLSCSLFIRYQECLDMVREAINYIDRFRVTTYRKSNNDDFNGVILNQIKKYYGLYTEIQNAMKVRIHTDELLEFMKNWEYPNNKKFNELLLEGIKLSTRITKIRPVQAYYARSDENIQSAIEYARMHPLNRIHDIIMDNVDSEAHTVVLGS